LNALLLSALASLLTLAFLLMSGKAVAIQPRLLTEKFRRPKTYWGEVIIAAIASLTFLILALQAW
jgi:hypothetical protein